MKLIQARNTLSRGLTGEEYVLIFRHMFNVDNKVTKTVKQFAVLPITLLDKHSDIVDWYAYNDDLPCLYSSFWQKDHRVCNWSGYVVMCKTRFYTSKAMFGKSLNGNKY